MSEIKMQYKAQVKHKTQMEHNQMERKAQIHEMQCSNPWWSLIRSGVKTVEGRRNIGRWKNIVVGDIIKFVLAPKNDSETKQFQATVTKITLYQGPETLKNYLKTETLEKTLPEIKSIEDGVSIYTSFYINDKTSEDQVKKAIDKSGFLAISIKLNSK
jgi:ASC-1-like (ASCH) protein